MTGWLGDAEDPPHVQNNFDTRHTLGQESHIRRYLPGRPWSWHLQCFGGTCQSQTCPAVVTEREGNYESSWVGGTGQVRVGRGTCDEDEEDIMLSVRLGCRSLFDTFRKSP